MNSFFAAEQRLDAVSYTHLDVYKRQDKFYTDIIADELNVKEVKFADDVESFISYSFKPQLRTVGPKYGKLLNGIRTALSEIDGTAAMKELRDNGVLVLDIDGNRVELAEEDLLIETAQSEGYVTETDGETSVVLDTNLTPELVSYTHLDVYKRQVLDCKLRVMEYSIITISGTTQTDIANIKAPNCTLHLFI